MQPEQLTQSLKQEARRLGFELSGTCPAVTPDGYGNFLQWLANGYAGEMHYLEQRKDAYQHPDGVMPGVKSILMLGMNYRTADHAAVQRGYGRVARYAWGQADYHDLIHAKLKQLKRFVLQLQPEVQVRGVVDTAPLLEREFAQLAGLGWQGKNTLLINKPSGSYYLMAALLIDVTLDYDTAFTADHCGTCTACLDACPTDAFVKPGVMDATRCISYLTIEHRSAIPIELRPGIHDWILGCDICQDVCPWNRRTPESQEPSFHPESSNGLVELRSLFDLDDDQFRQRFRKTPLWRPRRRGLLRNAAIVMGNAPDEDNLATLRRAIADAEPIVRGAAAWALIEHLAVCSTSAGQEIRELFRLRQRTENDEDVLLELSRIDQN